MEKIAVIVLWLLVVVVRDPRRWVHLRDHRRQSLVGRGATRVRHGVAVWTRSRRRSSGWRLRWWALLSLATFALSFAMPAPARPWARVTGVIGVGVMIWTVTFFIPLVTKTEGNRGAGLTGEEITRFTLQFIRWGYLRTLVALGAWLAALRALVLASR